MQGTIAQAIALTIWGRAALRSPEAYDGNSLYSFSHAFASCEYVKFVGLRRTKTVLEEVPYAADPLAWLRRIRDEGVHTLRLVHKLSNDVMEGGLPDWQSVGFVGGGSDWYIEAVKRTASDYWEARRELGNHNRSDGKIWRVTYGRIVTDGASSRSEAEVSAEEVKRQLIDHLPKIAAFARAHREEQFARAFDIALYHLGGTRTDSSEGAHHTNGTPADPLPEIAQQLLAAARAAWVFGGMGSWSDLGFSGDNQVQYETLSAKLYQLLCDAIVAAVNLNAMK